MVFLGLSSVPTRALASSVFPAGFGLTTLVFVGIRLLSLLVGCNEIVWTFPFGILVIVVIF